MIWVPFFNDARSPSIYLSFWQFFHPYPNYQKFSTKYLDPCSIVKFTFRVCKLKLRRRISVSNAYFFSVFRFLFDTLANYCKQEKWHSVIYKRFYWELQLLQGFVIHLSSNRKRKFLRFVAK